MAPVFTTATQARFAVLLRMVGFSRAPLPAWPTAGLCGAPCQPCVTPAQRRTPYARSSVLLRYPVRTHAHGPSSRAGGTVLAQLQARAGSGHLGSGPSRGPLACRQQPRRSRWRPSASRYALQPPRTQPDMRAPRTGPLPSPYGVLTLPCAMPAFLGVGDAAAPGGSGSELARTLPGGLLVLPEPADAVLPGGHGDAVLLHVTCFLGVRILDD